MTTIPVCSLKSTTSNAVHIALHPYQDSAISPFLTVSDIEFIAVDDVHSAYYQRANAGGMQNLQL